MNTTVEDQLWDVVVIGGGPAGMRAAEVAAERGVSVVLCDGKPSVGRKLLVAGKGGLNLTHGESMESFSRRYSGPGLSAALWRTMLDEFSPAALRAWAAGLGVETFQASSGRVYPVAMKAAPLLRRWLERLRQQQVLLKVRHRMIDWTVAADIQLHFAEAPSLRARAVVLALGGGSWPRTGSDGAWLQLFERHGVVCHTLSPANCGWECQWPDHVLRVAEGAPLKNLAVRVGDQQVLGELLVTRYGLEGGAIYQLGAALRAAEPRCLEVDFKPTFSVAELIQRAGSLPAEFAPVAMRRWKLADAAKAILGSGAPWADVTQLAQAVKAWRIELSGPRPLAEAISSAGGVPWSELNEQLMLRKLPGMFVAGEMLDWEAPTGGYLLQGCFATGTYAGRHAADWVLRGENSK